MIYVNITDHTGRTYITEVDETNPATGASLATERTPGQALDHVRKMIGRHEAIQCEIIHPNNRAKATVMFVGPVTLAVFRDSGN